VTRHSFLLNAISGVSATNLQPIGAAAKPARDPTAPPCVTKARVAEAAGITLIAVARGDGFETFTHPYRLL
jgi:FdhD protein